MRLVQYVDADNRRAVAADTGDGHRRVAGASTVHALALEAIAARAAWPSWWPSGSARSRSMLAALEQAGRLLPPLDHPRDPAHMLVTGTGLSHLGSAEGRDKMHQDLAEAATLTDSMRMFKLGLEGGKPGPGQDGRAARVVLQGRRLDPGRARASRWRARPSRSTAARSRRSSGLYLIGAGRHAVAARLRARQRVLRPRHREAELSLPRPFQAAHVRDRAGAALGELPARRARRIAHPPGRRGASGRSRSCRARTTCRHSIENLEQHHFKYAAVPPPRRRPRPFLRHGDARASPTGSRRSPATCSRSRWLRSGGRCATRWRWRTRHRWRRGRAGLSRPQSFAQFSRLPRSLRISRAALWPGMPLTPPPGCIELPQT